MGTLPQQITLTWPETEHAWDVGLRRVARSMQNGARARYGAPEDLVRAMSLVIASCPPELAVAKWANEIWHGPEPFDPTAPDVGRDIQVRFTDRPDGCLITHQADKDHERFYLVTGTADPRTFTIQGWLYGHEAKDARDWREDTGRPAWFTPQDRLRRG